MKVRNYDNLLMAQMTVRSIPNGVRDMEGVLHQAFTYITTNTPLLVPSYGQQSNIDVNQYGDTGLYLGTGDREVAYDDYSLSGTKITNITYTMTKKTEEVDGQLRFRCIYSITNTGSTDITIREVAYVAKAYCSGAEKFRIMLDRTLLETPLTIVPGGVGQLTYDVCAPLMEPHPV